LPPPSGSQLAQRAFRIGNFQTGQTGFNQAVLRNRRHSAFFSRLPQEAVRIKIVALQGHE
jgi:hypothetical protein